MNMGTRFFAVAVLVMITATALADGGAFEPDNVVRVDTLTVERVVEVPLRVDTVYAEGSPGCGVLELDDGRLLPFKALQRRRIKRMFPPSQYDGRYDTRWYAYRTCERQSRVVQLGGTAGYAWAN